MVKKINAAQFESEAENSAAAVVDFSAVWCTPCNMMAPVLEKVSETLSGKVDFYNIDVDEAPDIARSFQISSIPCLVMMKNGDPVSRLVGFRPEPMITSWIESNL